MFCPHRSPLFLRISGISLIALLPLLVLAIIHLYESRSTALQQERADLVQMVETTSRFVEEIFSSAEAILKATAGSPAIQGDDWGACIEMVERIDQAFERFVFVGVVDREGVLRCPSKPAPPGTHVRDRLWFEGVRQAQHFVVGEYAIGRASGQPSIHLAYPILRQGEFVGAADVGLDVEWLGRILYGTADRPHTVLYVLDGSGRILTHRPRTQDLIGGQLYQPALVEQLISQKIRCDGYVGAGRYREDHGLRTLV